MFSTFIKKTFYQKKIHNKLLHGDSKKYSSYKNILRTKRSISDHAKSKYAYKKDKKSQMTKKN